MRLSPHQHGQGLAEAVLLLGILGSVLYGLHWTGSLRQLTLRALQESTLLVFRGVGTISKDQQEDKTLAQQHRVENELLSERSGTFFSAESTQELGRFALGRPLGKEGIVRRVHRVSYAYLGAGQARSSRSAQSNIGRSKHFWRAVADGSHRIAKQTAARTVPIDAVWRRARPSIDWLSGWSELVPLAPRW